MRAVRRMRVVAVLAVPLVTAPPSFRQSGDQVLTVSAVRFYQATAATTTIEGVCEVRLGALFRGTPQRSSYRMEVAVLDSAGLELQRSAWTREVPAALAGQSGATADETFEFNAAPGRYHLRVRVLPTPGDPVEATTDVAAYAAAPAISDLLLASGVRQSAGDAEVPGQGEVKRAGLLMHTAPAPRLAPTDTSLSWYAEVYAHPTGAGELVVEVLGQGGRRVFATPPRPVTFPDVGGLTAGSVNLTGLPEGSYTLRLRVRFGDSTLTAEAPFSMAPVSSLAAVASAAAAVQETQATAGDPFEGAGEAKLDSLEAPLVYVARNPGRLSLYRTLSTEGKRRYLEDFWSANGGERVAGSVGRDEFYRLVAFVDEAFKETGAAQLPGWNTDRGRVFLKNGRWDERLSKPNASPQAYEVWKYTRGRARWYIFIDRTGLGNYGLLATNDSRENGTQQIGWEAVLGADATKDTYAFLGMDIRNFGISR